MTSFSTIAVPRPANSTGIGMVMMAAALWATVGVAVQITPEAGHIPEMVLAAARTGIAGPMLLAVWGLGLGGRVAELCRLSPGPLVVFAVASAVFQIFLFRCFAEFGVTAAVFLTVCLPPVLAWTWSVLRGRGGLSGQSALALALALGGMALVSLGGRDGAAPGNIAFQGLASGALASIAFVAMSFAAVNRPGFTGGQNSRRIAHYGTDTKEEDREAVFP